MTVSTFTVFSGGRNIASGALPEIHHRLKIHLEQHPDDIHGLLVFNDQTGKQTDINLQAPMLEPAKAGRGRPKLGVVSKEITLLPRHWDWLEAQPKGASATLRRLVEEASKNTRPQQLEALYWFMSAIAGNEQNFEEASRALFADDKNALELNIQTWSPDIQSYILERF